MNLTRLLSLALPAAALLTINSCKKDGNIPPINNPVTYNANEANAAFAALRSTPQSFTVTAGQYATVTGAQGTILRFYPSSFRTASGAAVTSGTVTIELIEAYKAGDMIRNRATTQTADGGVLNSGGEVKVTARQNGAELKANRYGISFRQPAATTAPMRTWTGVTNESDGVINWAQGPSGTGNQVTATTVDSFSNNAWFVFDSVSTFNWINCDYFNNNQSRTPVTITLPDTSYNPRTTAVFAIFPSMNSVARSGYQANTAPNVFSFSGGYQIPVGMTVKFVTLTRLSNGTYYAHFGAAETVTANLSKSITPVAMTEAAVLTSLAAL